MQVIVYHTIHKNGHQSNLEEKRMYTQKSKKKHLSTKSLLFLLRSRESVLLKSRIGNLQAQKSLESDVQDNHEKEHCKESHKQAYR